MFSKRLKTISVLLSASLLVGLTLVLAVNPLNLNTSTAKDLQAAQPATADSGYQQNDAPEAGENNLSVHANWLISVYDENGNLVEQREKKNLITDKGLEIILANAFSTNWVLDQQAGTFGAGLFTHFLYIGDCGEDALCTAPNLADTKLENHIGFASRQFVSPVNPEDNSVRITYAYNSPATGPNTIIREAGMPHHGSANTNTAILVNRITFDDLIVPARNQVSFDVTFSVE